MIGIVDYGVGNLFSLSASLEFSGIASVITADKNTLSSCEKIILPGVGAFGDAVKKLRDTGLFDFVKKEALSGKPILGICLGMQLLFSQSEEYGIHDGLDLIDGKITALSSATENLKIPHIGWNKLNFTENAKNCPILKYLSDGEYVYYVHSFYAEGKKDFCAANSDYGTTIAGVVYAPKKISDCGKNRELNVFGTQFHPEKSGETGLKILRAFADI